MTIVLYCQHVLGLGHYMRSLAIARAFAPHRVVFVSGGPPVGAALPPHVVEERLPALAMDAEFSGLTVTGAELEALKAQRAARFMAVMERERPEVLLVELYPFGRRAFEFELLPVLEAVRQGRFGATRTVCSLRDILVEKDDPQKYQDRVLARLNTLFDALLVHSDRSLFPLEETFPRAGEIAVPMAYTGFVTPHPSPGARERLRAAQGLGLRDGLVVASAGGGKVGGELLFAMARAWPLLERGEGARLRMFTGPFLDEEAFQRLLAMTSTCPEITVERFAGNFLDWLAAADVSLSLAGYNTTMNILAARVAALVWPFAQNREQRLRAERLAGLGALEVLTPQDFDPPVLAGRVGRLLRAARDLAPKAAPSRPMARSIGLDGAAETARLITAWPF